MVEDIEIKTTVSPFAVREGELKEFDGYDKYVSMNQIVHRINIANINDIKMKYEAERFPQDIDITDYREYSLELNHPDMIFIHNPYDECNNLTRVPQCYYSSNLKKHSELLIYSPYFTVGTYKREKQEFMFTMPGVYYADYVIAQSEKVKKMNVR